MVSAVLSARVYKCQHRDSRIQGSCQSLGTLDWVLLAMADSESTTLAKDGYGRGGHLSWRFAKPTRIRQIYK